MSCFRMVERGLATVVTDPFDASVGLSPPKLRADVITVSHDAPGHNNLSAVKGERRVIQGAGEYEIGGVFITGIAMDVPQAGNGRPNTLYVFEFEGLTVAHLGDLAFVPSQPQIEDLGAVDVARLPVGGGSALRPDLRTPPTDPPRRDPPRPPGHADGARLDRVAWAARPAGGVRRQLRVE